MKKHIIILVFIITNITLFSQKTDSKEPLQKYVELKYHYGKFARKTTNDVKTIVDNPYNAFNLRIGIQSNGNRQEWDQIYGFPKYGIGFYKVWFYGKELGSPQALYLFFKPSLYRNNYINWNTEISVGVAFGFNKYNPKTNKQQKVIGSSINSYFNLGTELLFKINKRFDFAFGGDLTHFSNGAVRTPNIGVNLFGLTSSIIYNFNNNTDNNFERVKLNKTKLSDYKKYSNIQAVAIAGGKTTTNSIYDGATYFASSLSLDYAYKYSRLTKIGFGLDGFYESALRKYPDPGIENPTFSDLTYCGIHLAHHLMAYNFKVIFEIGTYLTDKVSHKGNTYIVVTLDYYFSKNIFLSYHLKTRNGAVADFIGMGIGYDLKLN